MFIRLLSVFSVTISLVSAASYPVLKYSTYLRDNFTPHGIATDAAGNVYLAGDVVMDTTTRQTTTLVVKLNPQGTQVLYLRYVGGSANDHANAIAVDHTGNAFVAGVTTSPDFPVTSGGGFATPAAVSTERSFVFELDPQGQTVFSDILGGSTNSYAQAVAVNGAGQVLVSGTSVAPGFPSTPGVHSAPDTSFQPYLLELDATGKRVIFSATGIGGTSIAVDTNNNIYVAGTTSVLTYPTTPGSYQPNFPVFQTCTAPCTGHSQGPNQYVTKLDSTAAHIIYSTAVSGNGNTMNNGLAVDAAGNAYLTGLAGVGYPYTVTPPTAPVGPAISQLATPAVPFLSKLDASGAHLLYSVPVGGAGVAVDSNGQAYVGGVLGLFGGYDMDAALPALAGIPSGCLTPQMTNGTSAYAAQVDSSGNVLGAKFIGGSKLAISGVALNGTSLWMAGATRLPDFPFTPDALMLSSVGPNPMPGSFVGAVDFSTVAPAPGTPQIACMVNAANLEPAGPVAPDELLTIFGTSLGPDQPVSASNNTTTDLGGVSASFGSRPAPLLYVSSTQVNMAVPATSPSFSPPALQLIVNGANAQALALPVVFAIPELFVVPGSFQTNSQQSVALALNADGTVNSLDNPAPVGSAVSVFVTGLSDDLSIASDGASAFYTAGGWSVTSVSRPSPFVMRLTLKTPSSTANFNCQLANPVACIAPFDVLDIPSFLADDNKGLSFGGLVYVHR